MLPQLDDNTCRRHSANWQFKIDVTPLLLPSSLTEADHFMPRTIFQNKEMPPPHDDNTSRSYPASRQFKHQAAWRHTTTPAKQLDRSRTLHAPGDIPEQKQSHHHSMTTQADVTLPVDNSNVKQLDVTPLPLPSSLTEAELLMSRAIFQNISFVWRLQHTTRPVPSRLTEAKVFKPGDSSEIATNRLDDRRTWIPHAPSAVRNQKSTFSSPNQSTRMAQWRWRQPAHQHVNQQFSRLSPPFQPPLWLSEPASQAWQVRTTSRL